MYWLVSPIFLNATNTPKQMNNSTFKWHLILTYTSLQKLELNTFDCYGDFEDLNSKVMTRLLINLEEITRNSVFSGKSFKFFIAQIRVKIM